MDPLEGYGKKILEIFREIGAQVGDVIKVTNDSQVFEGTLIPKAHGEENDHLVIKLKSGYNIGIKYVPDLKVQIVSRGVKPSFKKPSIPQQRGTLPKIYVISTGGTIASRVDYRTGGVEPALDAEDLYSIFPELSTIANIKAQVLSSEFSENLTTEHWRMMTRAIEAAIKDGADGVVICHGTDTMGYTAAALSFALQDIPIAVVLVGSQRSSDRPSSDAASNLIGAVDTAIKAPFSEVVVAMHETFSDRFLAIHRGTKVRKCHTSTRSAFSSINSPLLARYNIADKSLEMLGENYHLKGEKKQYIIKDNFDNNVTLLKFYPDMNHTVLDWLISQGTHGIIIEGTGLGHVSKPFYKPIEKAIQKGIFVGMTSQCLWGRVDLQVYSTGRDLLRLGVTPLEDMLPETALVKLMWVLGQTTHLDEVRKVMIENISNEISPRRW